MRREVKKVLKHFKEIEYLEKNLNDFSLKKYLRKKGIEVNDDFNEDEFLEQLKSTVDELENYPKNNAPLLAKIIRRNCLDADAKKLSDVATELNLTYANAYKLKEEAIDIITIFMRNKKKECLYEEENY